MAIKSSLRLREVLRHMRVADPKWCIVITFCRSISRSPTPNATRRSKMVHGRHFLPIDLEKSYAICELLNTNTIRLIRFCWHGHQILTSASGSPTPYASRTSKIVHGRHFLHIDLEKSYAICESLNKNTILYYHFISHSLLYPY